MKGISWALKKYGNNNLFKLVIELENYRPLHIYEQFLKGQ